MKNVMKGLWPVVCILVCMCLSGCGAGNSKNSIDGAETDTDDSRLLLYYVNDAWSGFNPEAMDTDQLATAENLIDTVMTQLMEGGESTSFHTPVAAGMTYQRYTYDGKGTVNIIFTVDWGGTGTYEMLLTKAAFVKTLCQIDTVTTVSYELIDIVDDSSVVTEVYTETSFAGTADILESGIEKDIYMPDVMGKKLVKKSITFDMSDERSLEEQVIDALKAEYEGTISPLNGRTAVKSVTTEDGVCTVTFSEAFALGRTGVDNEIVVYSIVDSLVGLDGIQRVRLVIENSDSRLGSVSLESSLAGNYTYVEE